MPLSGLIQPQSILSFMVNVYFNCYDCSVEVELHCDLEDVSERRFFEKKKREYEDIKKTLADEFTITEKGFFPAVFYLFCSFILFLILV